VQLIRALPVLVAVVEQPPRHPDLEPAVAQPGQRVLHRGHGVQAGRGGHQVDDRLGRQPGDRGAADVLDRVEHPERDQVRAGRRRTDRPGLVVLDDLDHRTASILPRLRRMRPGR
jgi:hypothetical protein